MMNEADMKNVIHKAVRVIPAWTIYVLGTSYAVWLFYLGLTNQLGPEPVNSLEREYGEVALKLLVLGLAISPLRNLIGINLIKFRRAIGLTAFFFVVAHLSVWAVLDVQSFDRIWADILKRPYITIGFIGFLALLPLALTSNNRSLRRLGPVLWNKVHLLTYPAVLLAVAHYIWLVKGFPLEPFVYLAVIVALLALRFVPRRKSRALRA